MISSGKHSLLPPKSPFPSISPSYADYAPSPAIGSKVIARPREGGNTHHQRTSSEGFLIEEQPSWLDDLLNEPETPVRRGHRRSSSDSFAYMDATNVSNIDHTAQDELKFRNLISATSWGSQDFEHYKDARNASFYVEPNSFGRQKNRTSMTYSSGLPSTRIAMSCKAQDLHAFHTKQMGFINSHRKQDLVESSLHDPKASSEEGIVLMQAFCI
ncbi:Uncharacterized protein CK203_057650 [Vitis vinifera]|uniref:Uncharacterized protein n=1 Tax=Vitis vinifera TaxID=29760 RepID=A0A438GVQ0_VITVI|nr:Uncharacterized protein CK203_057650 [Vitis vinifera]